MRGAKYRLAISERKQLRAMGLALSETSQSSDVPPKPDTSKAPAGDGDEAAALADGNKLLMQATGDNDGDLVPPKVTPKKTKQVSTTPSSLLNGAPHASKLLGATAASELNVTKLIGMANALATVLGMEKSMTVEASADLSDVIDALDILLEKAMAVSSVAAIGLVPAEAGMRAVTKHVGGDCGSTAFTSRRR